LLPTSAPIRPFARPPPSPFLPFRFLLCCEMNEAPFFFPLLSAGVRVPQTVTKFKPIHSPPLSTFPRARCRSGSVPPSSPFSLNRPFRRRAATFPCRSRTSWLCLFFLPPFFFCTGRLLPEFFFFFPPSEAPRHGLFLRAARARPPPPPFFSLAEGRHALALFFLLGVHAVQHFFCWNRYGPFFPPPSPSFFSRMGRWTITVSFSLSLFFFAALSRCRIFSSAFGDL